ncbi:MAG: maltose acetyltransferase domain-containing protein, partial [Chitinophagaceae bacterium]
MDTEKQKMLRGEMYNAADSEFVAERKKARLLLMQLNNPGDNEPGSRQQFLRELIPGQGAALWIEPPFHCDYGSNIFTGDNVYFNFNCIILDV